jgi:lysylphosphatidylglycerol synthetase-like protein (DUF2156 family)
LRVKIVAGLTALGGVIAILSSLRPFALDFARLNRLFNPAAFSSAYRVGTEVVAVSVGVGLLYLAGNLTRRKHVAWMVAVGLFAFHLAVQVGHIVAGGPRNPQATPIQLGFTVLMLGLLLWSRRDYFAKSDPPTLFQFVRFVPIYFGVVFAYGFAALYLERDHLQPAPTFLNNVITIVEETVGVDGAYTYERRGFRLLFPNSLLALGIIGLAVALFLIFRPIVARPRTHADRDHASRLVHDYGTSTLAYFALRDDKSYFFASDGEAMIAYTYIGRYALASGDPIGRPESIDLVIDEFLAMCREHGWGFAFLAVREAEVERYLARGLRSFYLGDEAVIDCDEFKLEGKRNKSMRQSVHRVARTYRFEMFPESKATPELVAQLNAVSAKWRGKTPERGFTMALSQDVAGVSDEYELCVAFDEDDRPGGFLRVVPIFGDDPGFTLDMMRRDPDSPNGMTEYLVANTVFALREQRMRRLSMNFAVMGRLFNEDLPFTRRQRAMKWVISLLNPFFQIKSLHEFNRRFRPGWEPRVIIYEDQRALPQVALLYSGVEGFLALPVVGRYFVPRRFDDDSTGKPFE